MTKKIYIAGPLFNTHEKGYLEKIAIELESNEFECFLPHRDQKDVTEEELKQLHIQKKNVRVGDIILAIPSSGIHSNGYSLIRDLLKRYKIPKNLKKELLKTTNIYVKEVIKLNEKRLINSAAHITGRGITENLVRSIQDGLSAKIDLSKIKIQKSFRWI